MSKKRTSPKSIPATLQDVKRAYNEGVEHGKDAGRAVTTAIILTVLADKHGADHEIMGRVWSDVCELSQEIVEGRVKYSDLKDTLKQEYGIQI